MSIGVVVIGRNEGSRLLASLSSLSCTGYPVIYVDSGSSDGSVAIARSKGCRVLELDHDHPFTAARARNEGFIELTREYPAIQFVQFLDGDCTLAPGWLRIASATLAHSPDYAAVIGHLTEANASATKFNRLCAMEWKSQPGDLSNYSSLGGISMIRVGVFRQLCGFNQDVIAGEDSELGVRMSLAGYRISKLDHEMATHDANMTKFSQWWKRSIRAGHAIGQRAFLNGDSPVRDCVRERRSTLFWGLVLPLFILLVLPLNGMVSLLLLGGYVVLGIRVFSYRRHLGDSAADAYLYARYLVLAKLANGLGLIKFYWNKFCQRYEIIEYK